MKILLTGGTGLLGKKLLEIDNQIIAPNRQQLDITNKDSVVENIKSLVPNVVVHCAAVTSYNLSEENPKLVRDVNVLGTLNILDICEEMGIRLIYISTDYVFGGNKGNYLETDSINPLNNYSKTKASAELLVRTYENSLCIRTSFYDDSLYYEYATTDCFTTKGHVDVISEKIYAEIKSNENGIVHIYDRKRSIYDVVKSVNSNVKPISKNNLKIKIPTDVSLKSVRKI